MTIRKEGLENLLKLAFTMQGRADGVSLQDIQQEFQISRRTAERMRDSLEQLFNLIDVDTAERTKRWRLASGMTNALIQISAEELASLERAIESFKHDDMLEHAGNLDNLYKKLLVLIKDKEKRRIETDLEILIESEGFASRPGPRPKNDPDTMRQLRDAIIACKQCRIHYKSRGTAKHSKQLLYPYGFIFGHRHYLLAYKPQQAGFRYFALANISKVEMLNEYFTRDENFSLKEYSKDAFGIYKEKPTAVHLKFSKDVAHDVQEYMFHPSQKITLCADGTIDVRFTASGTKAICWHLFTWGEYVKIIKPTSLQDMYQDLLKQALMTQEKHG